MTRSATRVATVPVRTRDFPSVRMAVLELLADDVPRSAAHDAPSAEEQEFLDALRRIVARDAGNDLRERYRGARKDRFAWIFARYRD